MCSSDIFLGIIAILFPPLAVWVKRGICSADSLINIALCCLGFLPGLLHAWYIIAKYPEPLEYGLIDEEDPNRAAHVTYYYIDTRGVRRSRQREPQPVQGYGTMPQPVAGQSSDAQAGSSSQAQGSEIPPSYEQAVQGDHKVQSSD